MARKGITATFMAGVSTLIFSSGGATAQESGSKALELEEIIVTARFRNESIQDIGGSVAALDGRELERSGIVDIEDLTRRIAGVELLDRGPNANEINIRGVTNSQVGGGLQPLVSIMLDDISVGGQGSSQRDINLFDFNRVEVLRGPQPTYFGEGAMGGVIRYFSADPVLDSDRAVEGTWSAGTAATKGGGLNYRVENATSYVLVPEKLGVRLVGFYRDDDGFIDNPGLGTSDVNGYESFGGRAIVLARPTEKLTLRLAAHVGRDDIGELNYIEPTTIVDGNIGMSDLITPSLSLIDGNNEDDFELYSGKISYDAGPITIESITGLYKRRSQSETFAASFTYGFAAFFASVPPFNTASNLQSADLTAIAQAMSRERSVTQEFRFVSDFDSPLNFVAGVFYKDSEILSGSSVGGGGFASITENGETVISEGVGETAKEQFSGFVELNYDVSDRLRLFAGARYVNETVTSTLLNSSVIAVFNPIFTDPNDAFAPILFPVPNDADTLNAPGGPGTSFDFKLSTFLPRIALEYDLNDDVMVYGSIARGVRNGGLNSVIAASGFGAPGSPEFNNALTYDSDEIVSSEVGFKTRWMDDAVTFNIAGFYTEFKTPQIGISNPTALTANAPEALIYGLELESLYNVNNNLSLFFSGNVTEAEYKDGMTVYFVAGAPAGFEDLAKGNRPPNVPEASFSAGADVRYPVGDNGLELTGQAAFQYIGKRDTYPQNFQSGELGSMEMLNLRVGLESERWSLTAYMTNALNDLELQAISIPSSSATLVNGVLDGPLASAFPNRPRTTGLTLTVRY